MKLRQLPQLIPFIFLLLPGWQASASTSDYPHGCLIFYNGAERVFIQYLHTDASSSRHYSLEVSYAQGNAACEVAYSYTSPYSGGCTVNGATTGTNVTITSIVDCAVDHHLMIGLLGAGLLWSGRRHFNYSMARPKRNLDLVPVW